MVSSFDIFCLSLSFEDFDKGVIKKWTEGKVISLGIPAILQCEYGLSSPGTQCTTPLCMYFKQL